MGGMGGYQSQPMVGFQQPMGGMPQNQMMMNQMAMVPIMPVAGPGLSYQNPNHNNANMYN